MSAATFPLPAGFFGDASRASYVANETRAANAGLEPCITCGRGVAVGKGFVVTVVDGGANVLLPAAYTGEIALDPGFMGGYVVGSSCVKGIPAEFRSAWVG